MSRHRAEPPPSYRTRHGRVLVLGVSLTTTAIALLGGVGVLPSAADDEPGADTSQAQVVTTAELTDAGVSGVEVSGRTTSDDVSPAPDVEPETEPEVDPGPEVDTAVLPDDSGEGKRVVFSESLQRVWLVGSAGKVKRTYLVSGSLTDNLDPGTYEVYSRSEDATGIDDSGTMKWFVRFTQGDTGAAIGFHTIPVDDGERVQTRAQLGTPQSHGCIRQATEDALALWAFAPLGSTVVVV